MSSSALGRIEKIDLRKVWKDEAKEFTPWLAQPENIRLLGETIGVELEVVSTEGEVGPFRADIVCRGGTDNHHILIENQLERTDHSHLGQLMTYAAGLDAVTIVWVAQRFTDEHKSALDWLNRITKDEFSFFAIEVEVLKIGDSPMAPRFNLVCKPDDWARAVRGSTDNQITPTKKLQHDFWYAFREFALSNKAPFKTQKPAPQQWTNVSIGSGRFHIVPKVNTIDKTMAVYLCIHGPKAQAKELFGQLSKQRAEIDRKFGDKLEWRELPDGEESQISLSTPGDISDLSNWGSLHAWLVKTISKHIEVFGPLVKSL